MPLAAAHPHRLGQPRQRVRILGRPKVDPRYSAVIRPREACVESHRVDALRICWINDNTGQRLSNRALQGNARPRPGRILPITAKVAIGRGVLHHIHCIRPVNTRAQRLVAQVLPARRICHAGRDIRPRLPAVRALVNIAPGIPVIADAHGIDSLAQHHAVHRHRARPFGKLDIDELDVGRRPCGATQRILPPSRPVIQRPPQPLAVAPVIQHRRIHRIHHQLLAIHAISSVWIAQNRRGRHIPRREVKASIHTLVDLHVIRRRLYVGAVFAGKHHVNDAGVRRIDSNAIFSITRRRIRLRSRLHSRSVGVAHPHRVPLLRGVIPAVSIPHVGARIANRRVQRMDDHAHHPPAPANADRLP